MSTEHPEPGRSFGGVADAYDRGRPDLPARGRGLADLRAAADRPRARRRHRQAHRAAGGPRPRRARDRAGPADARDPPAKRFPRCASRSAPAEDIPAGDSSYDVVVSAQAFHWFDHEQGPARDRPRAPAARPALPGLEPARRADPVGQAARRGSSAPRTSSDRPGRAAGRAPALFGEVEQEAFRFWQVVDRHSIRDLVRSRSNIAVLPAAEQEAKMAEVLAFYDDYGRGMDGMQLPYAAQLLPRRGARPGRPRPSPSRRADEDDGRHAVSDGSSTDMLLIDFKLAAAPTGVTGATSGNRACMFQQDLQPVGDSLALSALCGALPLLALFVLLGGLKMKAWVAGLISLAVALRRGRRALRDAGRPGAARRDRGCGVRLLPDPLDRHQRDLGLQPHRRQRATSTCCAARSRRSAPTSGCRRSSSRSASARCSRRWPASARRSRSPS